MRRRAWPTKWTCEQQQRLCPAGPVSCAPAGSAACSSPPRYATPPRLPREGPHPSGRVPVPTSVRPAPACAAARRLPRHLPPPTRRPPLTRGGPCPLCAPPPARLLTALLLRLTNEQARALWRPSIRSPAPALRRSPPHLYPAHPLARHSLPADPTNPPAHAAPARHAARPCTLPAPSGGFWFLTHPPLLYCPRHRCCSLLPPWPPPAAAALPRHAPCRPVRRLPLLLQRTPPLLADAGEDCTLV